MRTRFAENHRGLSHTLPPPSDHASRAPDVHATATYPRGTSTRTSPGLTSHQRAQHICSAQARPGLCPAVSLAGLAPGHEGPAAPRGHTAPHATAWRHHNSRTNAPRPRLGPTRRGLVEPHRQGAREPHLAMVLASHHPLAANSRPTLPRHPCGQGFRPSVVTHPRCRAAASCRAGAVPVNSLCGTNTRMAVVKPLPRRRRSHGLHSHPKPPLLPSSPALHVRHDAATTPTAAVSMTSRAPA